MSDDISPDTAALETAATRLAKRPGFMAHVFAKALKGDVSAHRLGVELACTPLNAIRVALMQTPRMGTDSFRRDVAQIAEVGGVDALRLLTLIRQAQTLQSFAEDSASDAQSLLLAARDEILRDGQED